MNKTNCICCSTDTVFVVRGQPYCGLRCLNENIEIEASITEAIANDSWSEIELINERDRLYHFYGEPAPASLIIPGPSKSKADRHGFPRT